MFEGNFVSSSLFIVRQLVVGFEVDSKLTVSLIAFDMISIVSGLGSWLSPIISNEYDTRNRT